MSRSRLSLFNYDVVREWCEICRSECFHFVPIGTAPATRTCRQCGKQRTLTDLSDTSIWRLVTQPNGEVVVEPIIA